MKVLKPGLPDTVSAKETVENAFTETSCPRLPGYRIGVVGCGPRGLQCLEALSRKLTNTASEDVAIVVFEPAAKPGAGVVYDPSQPRYLRMNFATRHLNFWKVRSEQPDVDADSLLRWLERHHPFYANAESYIPRAIVGEYLNDCYNRVVARLERRARLSLVPATVDNIWRDGDAWLIDCQGTRSRFDEVAVTTGHEGLRRSRDLCGSERATAVPSTFAYCTDQIGASTATDVLVRGFGLTAIDAVLALTEGTGGRFVNDRLIPHYIAGDSGPKRITIQSRSGRPMLAKPTANLEPIEESFWQPYRDRLQRLEARHGRLLWHADVFNVVADATAALLRANGQSSVTSHASRLWYQSWCRGRMDAVTARRTLLQSYGVACGVRRIDIPVALGLAWRTLYPELVHLISYGGLDRSQWRSFRQTALEMERIAFGPPAESVGKLLSLMRSGRLRIDADHREDRSIDFVINAVIAGPHEAKPGGPIAKLIDAGVIVVDETTGAVKVDRSGEVTGAKGLAVFGRATEGWVLGNDTLNRRMHPQIERWAAAVASRLDISV